MRCAVFSNPAEHLLAPSLLKVVSPGVEGRLITSRRWFKKNTRINPDKIICWEHPNFADQIIDELDQVFDRKTLVHWPLRWPPVLDVNLVLRFHYLKAVS